MNNRFELSFLGLANEDYGQQPNLMIEAARKHDQITSEYVQEQLHVRSLISIRKEDLPKDNSIPSISLSLNE